MAILYAQSNAAAITSGATSVPVTFTSIPTVSNLVVIQVSGIGSSLGVSDNKGNTYTRIGVTQKAYKSSFSAQYYYTFFYSIVVAASSSFTITGTSNTSGGMAIIAHEYSGTNKVTPVDTFNLLDAGGAFTSDSITTTNDGSLIYLAVGVDDYGGGVTSVNTPFTLRQNKTSSAAEGSMIATADYIQPTMGVISGTWSAAAGSNESIAIIAFKPPSLIPANTTGLLSMF